MARSQARFFLLAEDDDPKCFSMFHPFFKVFIDTTWIYNLPPGCPLQNRRARILSQGGTILVFGRICQHFWIVDADGDVDLIYLDFQKRLQWIEQLQNGTLSGPRPLLGHDARDYVATDFDGDGDIDLVIAPGGKEGWEYYERREDGSLEELFEDSPFPDSLWKGLLPSTLTHLAPNHLCRPVFHVGAIGMEMALWTWWWSMQRRCHCF